MKLQRHAAEQMLTEAKKRIITKIIDLKADDPRSLELIHKMEDLIDKTWH